VNEFLLSANLGTAVLAEVAYFIEHLPPLSIVFDGKSDESV
jgi:hypothetical protein